MGIRKYKDDYEVVFTIDENGRETRKTVYRGKYFEISLDEDGLQKFKRYCLLLLAAIVVFHFSGGFVNSQGMYRFYVSLPYVLGFFPMFYFAEGFFRLPKEKRLYQREEVGRSFERMGTSSKILLIILGSGVISEILYLIFFSAKEQILPDYLFLTLEVLAATLAYFLVRLQQTVKIQTCDDPQQG